MHVAAMQPGCGDWVQTSPAESKSYFPSTLLHRRESGTAVDTAEGNGLFGVSSHRLLRLITVFDEVTFASQGVSGLAMPLHPFSFNTDKLYTHTHARTHARTHTRTDARTHARTHTHTLKHTHTHTHTHTHARTHARTHTHTHTHTRTHARTHARTQQIQV